jgi:hypothetical protein
MTEETMVLLKHCEKHMPDAALRADFQDCVLPEAKDDHAREVLQDYYNRRRRHRSFQPGSFTHNNHIEALATVAGRCEVCGKPARGRTCGARCRKTLSRGV